MIVNGQSMENVYHRAAVDALRQAGNTVTIVSIICGVMVKGWPWFCDCKND